MVHSPSSYTFPTPSYTMDPEFWEERVWFIHSTWVWTVYIFFVPWPFVSLCFDQHLLERETSLMRDEGFLNLLATCVFFTVLLIWRDPVTMAAYKIKHLIDSLLKVSEGRKCGSRKANIVLGQCLKTLYPYLPAAGRERLGLEWAFETSKLTLCGTPSSVRPHLLILS